MASTHTTTYESDELDSEQSSNAQDGGETNSSEEVIYEVMGTGDLAETESGTGEETTEAVEAENHKSVSNPPIVTAPTSNAKSDDGGSDEATDTESVFETVEGWEESTPTETTGEGETLIEAYYADAEAAEGGQEFFGLIAAAFVPLVKAVLPSLAGAAVQQGVKSVRLRRILARLSKLGISPKKLRETGDESDEEAAELDEAAFGALEQQLETLEVVIGRDDRVRITNTKANPWKRICHLKIKTATGKSYLGTGFFIGPRTIVTAGHCVYIHSQGGWAQQITVTPGRNGTEAPFKSYTATSFRSVKGWVKNKSRNYDYGVIILPESAAIPSEIGAFVFASYSNQSLLNQKLNTAGYPGDKPSGTLWFHGRKAKAITARTITYDIDSAGGQCGWAVWVRGSQGK
ncbi:MAG: trypsin-like serine protease, partial [Cyanobacteria bacterium CAN_BIN43]|nr:trypsin-like serine protease [Cyanobacteria bacterium CAN_BIN43]